MAVLGYLPKLKRGLGLAFGALFCLIFPLKWCLFNTLSIDKVSMSYPFIKQNVKLLFTQLMTSQTLRFIFHHPLKQKPTGKKGETNMQKCEYLLNEKSFLDEIINIFHNYFMGYYLVKKFKNSRHKC